MNHKRQLASLRESRDSWLKILNENPDSLAAAQFIASINSKIDFVKTLRILAGDYDD